MKQNQMTENEISERNSYLIALISQLNLGIHIGNLPHKPIFLNRDSTKKLNGYVHNFNIILTTNGDDEFFRTKLKPIDKMDIELIRSKFMDWLVMFEHTDIFTISDADSGLFLTGFNHHNRIEKKNPYPVFARYNPLTYYDKEKALSVVERFSEYNLKVN